jgi:MFS family permease
MTGFRRLWLAGLISDTGDWLLFVSLPIVVYERTGSTLGTAVAFMVELAPGVLLAPAIGRLADRPDRRRTLVAVSLAQAVALTPLLAADGLAVLYAVIALQAALAALFEPTKNALLPTLVERDRLVRANALVGLNQNLGRLVGGSLGGLLLATGGGLTTIVAVDAVSFLLAAGLIAGLPRTAPLSAAAPAQVGRPLRHGLIVLFLASVAQGIFVVLFVVFVARELHGDSAEIGLLRGVQAIGAIAGGLVLSLAARRMAPARLSALGATSLGLLSLAIWNGPALTTAQPVYLALFIAVGGPGIWLMTGLVSELQEASEDGRRGRAFTVVGVVAASGQALGMLAGGLLGDPLGVVSVLNVQAALYLAAGWYAAQGTSTSLPVLRRASRSSWARRASSSA